MNIPQIENENNETYLLRKQFIIFVMSIPETYISKFSLPTAILFSQMYVKKIQYGVKFDDVNEKILNFITEIME